MPSVSFKDFKEFSSHWTKIANNDDEEWEEEVIDSANTLHEVYCWNDECRWDEEEGFLHDPWLDTYMNSAVPAEKMMIRQMKMLMPAI